jgi:hypothetical protein
MTKGGHIYFAVAQGDTSREALPHNTKEEDLYNCRSFGDFIMYIYTFCMGQRGYQVEA